jgi:hypothetical protein
VQTKRETMTNRDNLLSRVRDGEWLGPVAAAEVIGVHRNTVQAMLDDGRLRWRWHPGGKNREVDPASVLEHLQLVEQVHRGRRRP